MLTLQNFPDHQFPSIVGRPILRAEERDVGDIVVKDIMCGDEAAAARSMLQITYPVRGSHVLFFKGRTSVANCFVYIANAGLRLTDGEWYYTAMG